VKKGTSSDIYAITTQISLLGKQVSELCQGIKAQTTADNEPTVRKTSFTNSSANRAGVRICKKDYIFIVEIISHQTKSYFFAV